MKKNKTNLVGTENQLEETTNKLDPGGKEQVLKPASEQIRMKGDNNKTEGNKETQLGNIKLQEEKKKEENIGEE